MNNKLLFVSGTFDDNGGRPSHLADKICAKLSEKFNVSAANGGFYESLEKIIRVVPEYKYVLWWPNVPNDKGKIRDVKSYNKECILVTSKRNDGWKYTFKELVNRALGQKANLCVEFRKQDDVYSLTLFDPLGNVWYSGCSVEDFCNVLAERMEFLAVITRQGTVNVPESIEVPDKKEFFDIVKCYADTFHSLIMPEEGVTRFLGNSSFRCTKGGFPSFRSDGGIIFVSKRNIDKRFIDKDGFVPCMLDENGSIIVYGETKPSVDTPIQLRLYNALPNINYMIHSHVYISGAEFTDRMIPCGGLEEVGEILSKITDRNKSFYALNLVGHGSIVMSEYTDKLKNIQYVSRSIPEILTE